MKIRSGGQTGVDRAALDVAIELGIDYTGWCPRGGWAEDEPSAPGVLARYAGLTETPSSDPRQRTAWNVRDSAATLVLVRGVALDSPGTTLTRVCAELVFQKPIHTQDLDAAEAAAVSRAWLDGAVSRAASGDFVLNVAGPRESESPGIYGSARLFLRDLLADR